MLNIKMSKTVVTYLLYYYKNITFLSVINIISFKYKLLINLKENQIIASKF
jgi:hypothetical protein